MVRNIQILPVIPPLPKDSGMRHVATSYEISYSPYFEDTENVKRDEKSIIVSNLEDNVNLNAYYFTIENLTENTELYARYKLHYKIVTSNGERDATLGWSSIVNLKGDQEGFKVSDVIVGTPTVTFTIDTHNVARRVINVKSSDFNLFIGYGDHIATTWEVVDSDGKTIFKIDRSKDLLHEIVLDLDMFKYNMLYFIKCTHYSTTNAESYPGIAILNRGLDHRDLFDVTVLTPLISERDLLTEVILHMNKFVSVDLMLKNREGVIVSESIGNKTLYPKLKIPKIKAGEIFYLYARLEYEKDKYTDWKLIKVLIGRDNTVIDFNKNIQYEKEYVYVDRVIQPGTKFVYSRELPVGGGFVLPKSDTAVFKGLAYYRIEAGQLVYVDDIKGSDNTGKLNKDLSNWNINIIPLYNGEVIINRTEYDVKHNKDGLGQNVFLKYAYNTRIAEFEYKGHCVPGKQLGSTGISGSAVATLDNTVWYIPANEGTTKTPTFLSMYKLDTENMKVTKVIDLPFQAHKYVSMTILNNTQFIIAGGMTNTTEADPKDWVRTNNLIYLYDVEKNSFTQVGDLSSVNLPKWYNLHLVTRRDSKIAIFNQSEGKGVAEDQSILIFDVDTGKIENLQNDFEDGRVYLRTLIGLNGNIYRISSTYRDPQMMYVYRTKGYNTVSNGDPDIITSVVTELVVPPKETVIVDNLYKYTKITIEGSVKDGTSGKLVTITKNRRYEFDASYFFLTKTLKLYNNTVDDLTKDKPYEYIVMLDGVDIEITDADKPII